MVSGAGEGPALKEKDFHKLEKLAHVCLERGVVSSDGD